MNPMKTSACEGWFSALNGEKTNLLQEFFSPSNWLSLQSSEPASNSMIHLHILSAFWTLSSIFWRKHCWGWWGEGGQGKDKAATSQTLKLCRKRKGGKGGFLHLRNYDTEKQKQKGFKICYCKIPRSPITGCVFYLSHLPSKRNSKYVAALALVTHECKLNWCSLIERMKEYQFPMIYYVAPGPGLSHISREALKGSSTKKISIA